MSVLLPRNTSQNGYNEIVYRAGSTFQSDGRCDYRKYVETHAKRSLSGECEPRESLGNKTQLTLLPKQVMLSAHGRHATVHKRVLLYATAIAAPSLNCFYSPQRSFFSNFHIKKSKVLSSFHSSNCCKHTLFALDLEKLYTDIRR